MSVAAATISRHDSRHDSPNAVRLNGRSVLGDVGSSPGTTEAAIGADHAAMEQRAIEQAELKNEAERDGTKDSRADCGSGKPGEDSLGKPPSDTPVGWEPPTAKRAA